MTSADAATTMPEPAPGSTPIAASVYDAYKIYPTPDGDIRALDGVTVGFPQGRFTAIMGPSGSGKSTLMQCAAGLDTLSAGRAFIGATEITRLDPTALTLLRRDQVGFIFQSFNLVRSLTAEENILLPLTLAKQKVDREHFDRVIDVVGLRDRLTHRPAQLSGGQQQRVAVARALIANPPLVFGDEPTGNLDSRASAEILGFLRRAVDEWGRTVVIVTHDPTAAAMANAVLFLADGRIVDWIEGPTVDSVLDRMKGLGS